MLQQASPASLTLAWGPSTDKGGVRGYGAYLNGTRVGRTSDLHYTFMGLACGTTYRLGVDAFDAAGNRSAISSVTASTDPCPDVSQPSKPWTVTQTGATDTSVSLSWGSSSDDVGVVGYGVYLNGVRVGTTVVTIYTFANLACGSSSLLGVDAFDAAGNRSSIASVYASTLACPAPAPPPPPPPPAPDVTRLVVRDHDQVAPDNIVLDDENDGTETSRWDFGTSDATGAQCALDGGAWVACSTGFKISAAQGTHTATVRALNATTVDSSPSSVTFQICPALGCPSSLAPTQPPPPPPPPPPPAPSPGTSAFGAYVGGGRYDKMLSFQAWVPRTVDVALDFFAGGSWAEIENPGWFLVQWPATQRVSWSAPMFPNDGSTLAGCASGAYNAHYVRLAQNMVASGHGDDIVRPGWEFNNNSWFAWRTNGTSTGNANYAACFRHIVTSMRSVAGQSLTFDWSPVNRGLNPEPAYPGDAYVDIIGNDAYDCAGAGMSADQRWQDIRYGQYGIQWQLNFAAAHGKLVSFPEWGVWSGRAECGGDSPYYITRMAELFRELGGRAAYQAYFEFNAPDGAHSLMDGRHPNAAAEYHRQFST